MPNLPISGLPAAGALTGTDLAVIVQGGITVQTTVGAFAAYAGALVITAYNLTKNNAAAADPTVGDDDTAGYAPGSRWLNTDTGVVFVCRDDATGAAVWLPLQAANQPNYIVGNFYPCLLGLSAAASAIASTTAAKLKPFMVSERMTVSVIAAVVGTLSAGGNFQLAIFANDPATNRPTGLPLGYTAPTLSTAAVAVVTGAMNVNVQLEPGILYWAALSVDNVTAAFFSLNGGSNVIPFMLGATSVGVYQGTAGNQNEFFSVAHVFGTMATLNINPAGVTTVGGAALRDFLLHFQVLSIP